MDVQAVEPPQVDGEAGEEVGVVPALGGRPDGFGEGAQAREGHVFNVFRRGNVLGPQLPLTAQDVVRLLRRNALAHRLEGIRASNGM